MGNRCWEGGVARANVGETVGRVQTAMVAMQMGKVDEREIQVGKEATELVNG